MGIEEQREEREVLSSIFPDEITDVSETEYRISITLEVSGEEDETQEAPVIILQVQYPDGYPDEAPRLDISAPPNATRYKYLNIREDKARLIDALQAAVEENIGMAMVFTLVSTLKDGAELLISERQKAVQALAEVEAAQAEEEENRKFHGTPVTRETFMEWRARFRKEMEEAEKRRHDEREVEDKKKRIVKEERRLTGKELWERGLVGKVEEEDEGEDALEDMQKLKIEA